MCFPWALETSSLFCSWWFEVIAVSNRTTCRFIQDIHTHQDVSPFHTPMLGLRTPNVWNTPRAHGTPQPIIMEEVRTCGGAWLAHYLSGWTPRSWHHPTAGPGPPKNLGPAHYRPSRVVDRERVRDRREIGRTASPVVVVDPNSTRLRPPPPFPPFQPNPRKQWPPPPKSSGSVSGARAPAAAGWQRR